MTAASRPIRPVGSPSQYHPALFWTVVDAIALTEPNLLQHVRVLSVQAYRQV